MVGNNGYLSLHREKLDGIGLKFLGWQSLDFMGLSNDGWKAPKGFNAAFRGLAGFDGSVKIVCKSSWAMRVGVVKIQRPTQQYDHSFHMCIRA